MSKSWYFTYLCNKSIPPIKVTFIRKYNININDLFERSLVFFTLDKLASHFGLHKGTVVRWFQKKEVPKNYKLDFLRLLNINYKDNFSVKEKDQYYTKSDVALKCLLTLKKVLSDLKINYKDK